MSKKRDLEQKRIYAVLPTDLALIRSKRDVDLLQRFDPLRRQRVADLLEPLLGAHCGREQTSFFSFFTPNLPNDNFS